MDNTLIGDVDIANCRDWPNATYDLPDEPAESSDNSNSSSTRETRERDIEEIDAGAMTLLTTSILALATIQLF